MTSPCPWLRIAAETDLKALANALAQVSYTTYTVNHVDKRGRSICLIQSLAPHANIHITHLGIVFQGQHKAELADLATALINHTHRDRTGREAHPRNPKPVQ